MTFNSTNRKLTSSTGYLRDKRDGWVCDHEIYLGNRDDEINYEEITETSESGEPRQSAEEVPAGATACRLELSFESPGALTLENLSLRARE